MTRPTGPVLSGARAIGKALNCSASSVYRGHRRGSLPTFQIGERTSPIKITRKNLQTLRRGRDGEE